MPIPDYEILMLPVLKSVKDKKDHKFADIVDAMGREFCVSPDEQRVLLPSGKYPVFRSRVSWAKTYLSKALLVEVPKRGHLRITQRGIDLLKQNPKTLTNKQLHNYAEFVLFHKGGRPETGPAESLVNSGNGILTRDLTPIETIENAFIAINQVLAEEILTRLKENSPAFFEQAVIDLLVAMGYGGNRKDAARVVGGPHDGGIDGVIKQDRLGLDVVYIQAKRLNGSVSVSSEDVQKFVGALHAHHATKGIFITIGQFSKPAEKYIERISNKIILIDGEQLAKYMIEFGLGASVKDTYQIKILDSDYFDED